MKLLYIFSQIMLAITIFIISTLIILLFGDNRLMLGLGNIGILATIIIILKLFFNKTLR